MKSDTEHRIGMRPWKAVTSAAAACTLAAGLAACGPLDDLGAQKDGGESPASAPASPSPQAAKQAPPTTVVMPEGEEHQDAQPRSEQTMGSHPAHSDSEDRQGTQPAESQSSNVSLANGEEKNLTMYMGPRRMTCGFILKGRPHMECEQQINDWPAYGFQKSLSTKDGANGALIKFKPLEVTTVFGNRGAITKHGWLPDNAVSHVGPFTVDTRGESVVFTLDGESVKLSVGEIKQIR